MHLGVFFNLHTPNTEVAHYAEQLGFSVELIPCRGKLDRITVRTLRAYIQEHGIDLLHAHGYKADFYGYLASRNTATPIISTCHLWTRSESGFPYTA